MLEAGKILQNRYRIEKQIGQGGMGAVYIAVDERFGSTVAIKETLFLGENFERAFEREARLLNSLRHPALPNVRDYFTGEHNQYLVMEFIPGEDLSERLEKNGEAFAIKEVLDWAKQLLEALDFLHTQEFPVIHRDIKPQNLKLTPRGQIILLDFGLAKGNTNDASQLTNAKSIFGYSRNYASLEQMQGTGTDPRSDIYSLAATIYHLITGSTPVDALTRAMKVLNGQPDPLIPANQLHSQVPKGIANILSNAMNLNANQRPASAKELAEMLENSADYEDLEVAQTALSKGVTTNFLNQDTQIFDDKNKKPTTNGGSGASTGSDERETEINSGVSTSKDYKTNVVAESFYQNPKSGARKSVLAIGAVLSLLLVAVGASAFIFLNLDESDGGNRIQTIEAEPNLNPSDTATIPNTESGFNKLETAAASNNSNTSVTAENPVKTEAKRSDLPKPQITENNTARKTGKSSKDEPEMVFVDPEEGNVRIKGDRIETDKVIITDKGVIFKNPPVPPAAPKQDRIQVSPEQIRPLTPQQIKRLTQIRINAERQRRMIEQQTNKSVKPPEPPE